MTSDTIEDDRDWVEAVRRALIDAALIAHEDAGLGGLCGEGRWEAAVDAMRTLDLGEAARLLAARATILPADRPVPNLVVGLSQVVAAVAGTSAPPPGGGSVAAAAGALAAALTQMVAGLTAARPKYAPVAAEMQEAARRAATLGAELATLVSHDAVAFEAVTAAYQLPRGTDDSASTRAAAIERAMGPATVVPLEIARAAASVAELAANVAERGNANAVADAAVATLLAEAVCRAAALTVRVNVPALRDTRHRLRLMEEAEALTEIAGSSAARAVRVAERTC